MINLKINMAGNGILKHIVLCFFGIYTLATAFANSMQLGIIFNINEISFLLSLITFGTAFGTLAYSIILLLFIIKCMVKHLFIRYYLILFSLYSAVLCGLYQYVNLISIIKNSGLKVFVLDIAHMSALTLVVAPLIFAIILINDEIRNYKKSRKLDGEFMF